MTSATTARIVLSTAGTPDEASHIARTLVEEQLAACVNIVPGIRSIYAWQGRIHDDQEWMLVMKSDIGHLEALEARLKSLHSYDNPEILVLVPESGSEAYLLWIDATLSSAGPRNPSAI